MPIDNGTGTTITFGTTGFTASVTSISFEGVERPSIDTTHLGTTGGRTFIPGDLPDYGSISLDIQFDPDTMPPITAAPETITVTFPLSAGATTPATWAATGFVMGFDANAPLEELMTGTISIKISGDVTDTAEV